MRKFKWNLLILILVVGLTDCKKQEDDETPNIQNDHGAIFVTVVFNGQPISDAMVSTEPETIEIATDETGNAMIENVPTGIYQVFATKDGLGSGSGALAVNSGDLGEVNIQLVPGGFEGPVVDIIMLSPQAAGVGEIVSINAIVYDNTDAVENIAFEWSTDVDGVISTAGAGSNGVATMEHVFDTEGARVLSVTVTNSEGNTDTDQIELMIDNIPDPVVLDPIEVDGYTLQLNWSQTDADDFVSYKIYRQGQFGNSLIEEINDIATTHYTDSDINVGIEYSYQIRMYLDDGNVLMSNIESGQCDGESIYIGTGLDMIRHDPNNPIIYGLDTDNNSLVIINTELEEVVNTIYVGSLPTDMDFSLDHQLLYIANYGSTEIAVVDLASQSVQTTYSVDTELGSNGGNPYTLAVMANGLLAFSSEDQWNNIKVVDASNGINQSVSNLSVYYPYLASNSDGTKLFVGRRRSGTDLRQYDLVNDELVFQESIDHYGSASNLVLITNNDEHVFYGLRKYLASDISTVLGEFSDKVYAINANGSRVLGEEQVFNGNDFSVVGDLPISTRVSVFGNDNSTAYLYYEELARLYKFTVE